MYSSLMFWRWAQSALEMEKILLESIICQSFTQGQDFCFREACEEGADTTEFVAGEADLLDRLDLNCLFLAGEKLVVDASIIQHDRWMLLALGFGKMCH